MILKLGKTILHDIVYVDYFGKYTTIHIIDIYDN